MDSYYEQLNLTQVLDDLQRFSTIKNMFYSSRFIINIPDEELSSIERICFQIEQAHWYYEDFVREQNPSLPSFSLKKFSAMFFEHCPLLDTWAHDHEKAFNHFMQYKVRVPVCGAILLNEGMDKTLLVRGWKSGSTWSFPRGKINKQEAEVDCAVREILEETGFDITPYVRENDYIELIMKEQKIRLYIVQGINENTEFETRTRKEIGAIEWYKLVDLPGWKHGKSVNPQKKSKNKFYMVTVFMGSLRTWIGKFKKQRKTRKITREGIKVTSGYKSATDADSEAEVTLESVPDTDHFDRFLLKKSSIQPPLDAMPLGILSVADPSQTFSGPSLPPFPHGNHPLPPLSHGHPPSPYLLGHQQTPHVHGYPLATYQQNTYPESSRLFPVIEPVLMQSHLNQRLPAVAGNMHNAGQYLNQIDRPNEGNASSLGFIPGHSRHSTSHDEYNRTYVDGQAVLMQQQMHFEQQTAYTTTEPQSSDQILYSHKTSLLDILRNGNANESILQQSTVQAPRPPVYNPDTIKKPNGTSQRPKETKGKPEEPLKPTEFLPQKLKKKKEAGLSITTPPTAYTQDSEEQVNHAQSATVSRSLKRQTFDGMLSAPPEMLTVKRELSTKTVDLKPVTPTTPKTVTRILKRGERVPGIKTAHPKSNFQSEASLDQVSLLNQHKNPLLTFEFDLKKILNAYNLVK